MENGATDTLTLDFMEFSTRAFTQSEQVIKNMPKCDKDWDIISSKYKKISFQVIQSNIMEWNKLEVLIGKFVEYATMKKNEGNLVIADEFLTK